jgi:hypothetical protein
MYRRIQTLISLIVLLAFLVNMVQPALAAFPTPRPASSSPVRIPLEPTLATPGSARAAKLEAIRLVEAMRYPDPDTTPPGKDFRKEYILLELRASIDGTFRSDNFLIDGSAFDHDVNAATRLRDMLADPQVGQDVKDLAMLALQAIVSADRLVTSTALEATSIFGPNRPREGPRAIERAQQELAKGDDKAGKGMPVDAIRDYRKAWEYTDEALDILWTTFDPDGDQLLNSYEAVLGSDPQTADSDSDGLNDADELLKTATDSTRSDSDNNGIPDGDEDLDADGLTALEELAAGTHPLRPDTDGEGLTDAFELSEFGSDPFKQDTDADGLTDDSELRLGTDPRHPDTDGDGLVDGLETYTSTATTADASVSVELTGMGDVARTVTFRDVFDDTRFQQAPGRLSPAIDITADAPFANARVKIRFDPAQVPNGDFDGLRILYYDENAHVFLPLPTDGVDPEAGYAWADTTHFTVFVLFYIPNWQTVWTHPMDVGGDSGGAGPKNLDVVLVIDSSGSMRTNDPLGFRRIAAKAFIDALVEGDRVAVYDLDFFAGRLQRLTTDFAAAKAAVDRIDDAGGTNLNSAVFNANRELINFGDPEHIWIEILLTDGQSLYNPVHTSVARDAGITIYTIGLGPEVDDNLLRSIAEGTGGRYFSIASAEGLPEVFRRIGDETGHGATADTDGDGLPDIIET